MKKNLFSTTLTMLCTVAMLLAATLKMQAQTPAEWKAMKGNVTMYMTNDMGRNGYYDQKPIAELMGHMGETLGPKCVLAVGDIHHFNGVASVNDPLWTTNYEQVYSHPELMLNWFSRAGQPRVPRQHTGRAQLWHSEPPLGDALALLHKGYHKQRHKRACGVH